MIIRSGGQKSFVDGVHIYLPDRISLGQGETVDRLAYRVLTARNVGFLEFGSMDLVLEDIEGPWLSPRGDELPLERCFRSFPNTQLAKDLFWIVEHRRIESQTRAKYPGVARAMDELGAVWRPARPSLDQAQPVEELVEALYRISIGEPALTFRHQDAAVAFEVLRPWYWGLQTRCRIQLPHWWHMTPLTSSQISEDGVDDYTTGIGRHPVR